MKNPTREKRLEFKRNWRGIRTGSPVPESLNPSEVRQLINQGIVTEIGGPGVVPDADKMLRPRDVETK